MSQNNRKSLMLKQDKMINLNKSRVSVAPKSLIRPSMGNFNRSLLESPQSDERTMAENSNLKDLLYSKDTEIKQLEGDLKDIQRRHNTALLQIQKDSNKKVEKMENRLNNEKEKREKMAETLEYLGIDPNTSSAIELSKKDAQVLKECTERFDNKVKIIQNNIKERKQIIQSQMSQLSSILEGI